jgi:hypothetical protein
MKPALLAAIVILTLAGCQSREDKLQDLRTREAGYQVKLIQMEREGWSQYCYEPGRCVSRQVLQDSLTIVTRRIDRLLR